MFLVVFGVHMKLEHIYELNKNEINQVGGAAILGKSFEEGCEKCLRILKNMVTKDPDFRKCLEKVTLCAKGQPRNFTFIYQKNDGAL